MAILRQIKQEIDQGNSLKQVAQIYSEIATLKLKQIRQNIERNRGFIREIGGVFQALRTSAIKQHIRLPTKKKPMVCLLLTSNYRFYGDLEHRLSRFFIAETAKMTTDRLVIGRVGKEYLNSFGYHPTFTSLNFKTDTPTTSEIGQLIKQIQEYQQVLVFYSQLKSVMIQEPKIVDISQSPLPKTLPAVDFDFIFEPEIPRMLEFFDSSISSLLIEQAILESELARTASRIISMDQAEGNADIFLKRQQLEVIKLERSEKNIRLLNTVSSLLNLEKNADK